MFKNVSVSVNIIIICVLLCFLTGCEEKQKKAEKKSSVVSKKISLPQPKQVPSATKPATPEKKVVAGDKEKKVILPGESEEVGRIYDPKNRLDPFEPLFKDRKPEISAKKTGKPKKIKRKPLTPLEKISLDQLRLVAVVRTSKISRALVEDTSGKGYVITKGTYIGLNSGRVIKIDNDSISIEEEKENLLGEYTTQIRALKLQKPPGE